jgi:hypothetical protein
MTPYLYRRWKEPVGISDYTHLLVRYDNLWQPDGFSYQGQSLGTSRQLWMEGSTSINYGKSSGNIHSDTTTKIMQFALYRKALNVLASKADV